jgi:peptidoglycan glycosyltransferase
VNKPIRTISIFCLLLFVALLVNTTWLQYGRAESLDNSALNRRVIEAAYARERGAILVGRNPVAESVPVDDKYDFQRTYDQPFKYAPITGYFSFFSQTGVERSENSVLSGDDSLLFVTKLVDLLSNQSGKGGSVQLTINQAAQDAAYAGLSALPGDVKGSVVALEPSTGKILAMVSLPTYDPNLLASHDLAQVDADYKRLSADENEPLLNRAIQQTLPPGSTFKIVTAAAAIESGKYTANDDVPGGASYQLPQTSGDTGLIDNEGRDCGNAQIPFAQAMENSCNTTFAQLGVQLGADELRKQAEAFGFNSDYLTDLRPQATSVFPAEANEPQAGQAAIGQYDVRATSLQMAMVVAAIANQGTVMRPYVIDEVQSPDYDVLDKRDPTELSKAVSPSTAAQLTDLLVKTVDEGTASPAAIPGFSVAGKTGTAQSGNPDVPPYAWFVSFAPADDPQVAVAVSIESASGIERGEIAGGQLGGPIAKAVMEAIIK